MHHLTILSALMAQAWAMEPMALGALVAVIERWTAGERLAGDALFAAIGEAPAQAAARRDAAASASGGGGVAVIPVFGVIAHRAHMVESISGPGGTSTEKLSAKIDAAVASSDVGAIVLDIDSPGGAVPGTQELVDKVHAARAAKPIIAVANSLAASAAYHIGSAATELVMTPSGTVGSIGVLAVHQDRSAELAVKGHKLTMISAGRYKTEGNSSEPLSDEAREQIQAMVDQAYGVMLKSIARNRGISVEAVRSGYGEGRVFSAQDALARGMVDRVATLEETIARMANPRRRSRLAASSNALRLAAL